MKQQRGDYADAGKNHEMTPGQPPREPAASRRLQFSLSPLDQLQCKRRITRIDDRFASGNRTNDAAPLLGREALPFPGPLVAAEIQLCGML
jgi:hypothetical protein